MKKTLNLLLIFLVIFTLSCKQKPSLTMLGQEDKTLDSLISIGKFTPELLWKLGRVGEMQLSPDGKVLIYTVTHYSLKENKGRTDLFSTEINNGEVRQIASGKTSVSNICWRPDGKKIAFLSSEDGSSQIWEMNPDGNNKIKLSKDAAGINGFWYSPKMDHFLLVKEVKLDTIPTDRYPDLLKANVILADELNYREWDSWNSHTNSHIFVATYKDGKLTDDKDIMTNEHFDCPGKADGGMEQLTWSPDGRKVAYTCKKARGTQYALSTNTDIFLFNLDDNTTKNLSSGMMGYDRDPVFSPDGSKIAWRSMETAGYESDKDRVIVYDFQKNEATDYSKDFDYSSANFNWSKEGNKLYFISGIKATFQVCCLNLAEKSIHEVTKGDHDYTNLIVSGDLMLGAKMSMSLPTEIFKIDEATGLETQLTFTNKKILDKIKLAKVEKRMVKTTDGKEMLTWVIYPPNFDPSKKYPALLFCEGGPQDAVSQFFSYRWNIQMMAANDYIVVAPNRRGVPSFGKEWLDQIAGDYGGQNMKDYISAIEDVAKEPYVNHDKLGAVGASYGGYSVYWLAGHNEDKLFKAFIAHCGMFNLQSWYSSTEEYWFPNHDLGGAYWQNPRPKSYDFSPNLYVDKWNTPIMIISGGNDFRIPYTESIQAFNSAQLRGIPSRLLFFPEESHFVLKPQNSILWQREFFRWLDRWLK